MNDLAAKYSEVNRFFQDKDANLKEFKEFFEAHTQFWKSSVFEQMVLLLEELEQILVQTNATLDQIKNELKE